MEISPAVASELVLLSRALGDLPDDLARRVTALSASAQLAVPSYMGLTLRLREEPPVHLTWMTAGDDTAVTVGSSLVIPRLRVDPAHVPSTGEHVMLVLYAARAGAFVDLAADLALLTGTDLADVVLDRHLSPPPDTAPVLRRESIINQAIGALIGRGRTPHEAWAHLESRTTRDRSDRWTASARLLDELLRQPPLDPGHDGS